jgi:hypothetical protein
MPVPTGRKAGHAERSTTGISEHGFGLCHKFSYYYLLSIFLYIKVLSFRIFGGFFVLLCLTILKIGLKALCSTTSDMPQSSCVHFVFQKESPLLLRPVFLRSWDYRH